MTGLRHTSPDGTLIHASCVAIGDHGVLLLGGSGSGKSDLALRLVDQAGNGITKSQKETRLVADDQVVIRLAGDRLVGSAPAAIAGQLEIRGLGIVAVPFLREARIGLAVRLSDQASIERMPALEGSHFEILGRQLPMVFVDPTSASAPARIRAAVDWLLER
ncbi:MAG: HPr kinase/phosphatase C-terminal domain-containing protein [Rhizobiales bacterium]|nr:HPr kinase/phosphatase C-terminal domain-containing protein [Hyphomicrobiales bacterium]MBI3673356.1 HPr kinase/phosphatase C-terminal domain-containing protein [Hyphomicrobiales bacterium]